MHLRACSFPCVCGSLHVAVACAKTYVVNNRHVIELLDSLLLQLGSHFWCCCPTPSAAPKGARRAQRRFFCLIGARLLLLGVDHIGTRGHVAHGSRRRSNTCVAVQSGLDRAHRYVESRKCAKCPLQSHVVSCDAP